MGISSVVGKGFSKGKIKQWNTSLILEEAGSLWLFGAEESDDENYVQGRLIFQMGQVVHFSWSVCHPLIGTR